MTALAGGFYIEPEPVSEAEEAAQRAYTDRHFPQLRERELSGEERLSDMSEPLAEGDDADHLDRQLQRLVPGLR